MQFNQSVVSCAWKNFGDLNLRKRLAIVIKDNNVVATIIGDVLNGFPVN